MEATHNDSILTDRISFTVNGCQRHLMLGTLSVTDLLKHLGVAGNRIAVERNGEIVPKSQHSATRLMEGDCYEIVVAVGGG